MRLPWLGKPVPVPPVLIQEAGRLQTVQSHLWARMTDQRTTAAAACDMAQEIRQNAVAIAELLQAADRRGEQFQLAKVVPDVPEGAVGHNRPAQGEGPSRPVSGGAPRPLRPDEEQPQGK